MGWKMGTQEQRRYMPRQSNKVRWRQIYENPRYEISEEGKVRVRMNQWSNPGRVLSRHWEGSGIGSSDKPRTYIAETEKPYLDTTEASLCVYLYFDGGRHKVRRIWRLMERYWPDVEYPAHWKPGDSLKSRRPELDRRCKLTWEQRQEIINSDKSPSELAKMYPVGRRYISQLKNGK
jgi:hypothetical protein